MFHIHFQANGEYLPMFEDESFDLINYAYVLHEMPAYNAKQMVNETDKFMIGDTPDGVSYIIAVIDTCMVKTKATPTFLRIRISNSVALMEKCEFNIAKFNQ